MTTVAPLETFQSQATIAIKTDVSVAGWTLRVRVAAPMITDLYATVNADRYTPTGGLKIPASLIGKPYELHLIDLAGGTHLLARGLITEGHDLNAQEFAFDSSTSDHDTFETVVHDQDAPSDTWTIAHGLERWPSVTVVDSAGTKVEGGVQYLDINTVQITFSAPFSGRALIGG